jgi:hypothetical protein
VWEAVKPAHSNLWRKNSSGSGILTKFPIYRKKITDIENMHPFVITRDNLRFLNVTTCYRQVHDVPEYRFDDIRKDDIVIDIGANSGAFCIRAAHYSDKVYAVEPLTSDLLRENIRLNEVSVTVYECALGNGEYKKIEWDGMHKLLKTVPLGDIISMAGGCDFLKCDCEGAEWSINPHDLAHVRRLEMELHMPPIGGLPDQDLLDYIGRNYSFLIDQVPGHGPLGLMGYLHATRLYAGINDNHAPG